MIINFNITAEEDIKNFNGSMMKGQAIRVMWSSHTSVSGLHKCNVFVKNFPNTYNEENLKETFEAYGSVISCKVCYFIYNYYIILRYELHSLFMKHTIFHYFK